jgi:CRP-like cAMP-binding protein
MDLKLTEKLIEFFKTTKTVKYTKGELIVRGNDEPGGVFFILEGFVKMSSLLEDGTEVAIHIYKPGTFIPMIWALAGIENTYYYRSLTAATLYKAPKEKFLEFLRQNPDVLMDLTSRVLLGLDGVLMNTKHLLYANSTKKVAIIIATLCRRFGVIKENGVIEISLVLTHQELAQFAGVTRETVSLAIEKLKSKGIVSQDKRRFVVKDLKALEEL